MLFLLPLPLLTDRDRLLDSYRDSWSACCGRIDNNEADDRPGAGQARVYGDVIRRDGPGAARALVYVTKVDDGVGAGQARAQEDGPGAVLARASGTGALDPGMAREV